jgi:trichothecene 3-O-acetyltransferase
MESSTQCSKVRPSESGAEHTIKLSVCDAYAPKVFVTQTHFWPLPAGESLEPEPYPSALQRYAVLREALSRTLSEVPMLGGTVVQQTSDPRDLAVRIGHDAYVGFVLDDCSGRPGVPSYAELQAAGFPVPPTLAQHFSQPVMLQPVHEGSPTFIAKLNVLEGGLALTVAANHLVADAAVVNELQRIWSQHAMDVSNNQRHRHRRDIPELSIRARLSKPVEDALSVQQSRLGGISRGSVAVSPAKAKLTHCLRRFQGEKAGFCS